MNGYQLNKKWFSFSYENKDAKPIHTAIYLYAIEHCNKLGWKKEFSFPTDLVMEILSIKSYNTYAKALRDLVSFGFIEMIEKSKNQWTANIIALSNYNKASNEALDKASAKHVLKQLQSTGQSNCQSIDSIIKLLNYKTIKLINTQTEKFCVFVENNLNLIFDLEEKEKKQEFLLDDFIKKTIDFFSLNTEVLEMRFHSFLRQRENEGNLTDFVTHTFSYMEYKELAEEKIHSWNSYSDGRGWQEANWKDKLYKLQKQKTPKTTVDIS